MRYADGPSVEVEVLVAAPADRVWPLVSLSGGRFILGIGTSGPQVMEGWHGVRFDKPVTRTRETSRSSA